MKHIVMDADTRLSCADFLREMADLLEAGNHKALDVFACFSPAGDGYGRDNYFIDFSAVLGGRDEEDDPIDIGEIITMIRDKEKIIAKQIKEHEESIADLKKELKS
jgi:hypothetical protein